MRSRLLYKYCSYETGLRILQTRTLAFSQLSSFNDPFEMDFKYPPEEPGNPFAAMHVRGKEHAWDQSYAALCLTRAPLHPLMWAHYADSHRGFCVGIDPACEGFLECPERNFMPASWGVVQYVSQLPELPHVGRPVKVALEKSGIQSEIFARMRYLFLTKSIHWSYEEEVRVLRHIRMHSWDDKREASGRVVGLANIPDAAIKEVYLGLRSPLLEQPGEELKGLRDGFPGTLFFRCFPRDDRWELGVRELGSESRDEGDEVS